MDEEVVYLTVAGERLVTTAKHPFYTGEGVWVEAGDLQPGDTIRTATWATGQVEAVTIATDPQPMYNFTVATAHTYFVGDGEWLVHNAGNCGVALQSKAGVVSDAVEKGFHLNVTNLKKGGAELGLQVGNNNTILLSPLGTTKVNPDGYVKDVAGFLAQNSGKVINQLEGIITTYGSKHFRSVEAQKLIDLLKSGTYTVATK